MVKQLPPIKNQQLLSQALTHRSYVNEHSEGVLDNERLEFLGDAVLGFLVGELLFRLYPDLDEAQLTRLRSKLVDEQQLSILGNQMGLGPLMRLGKGAEKDRGRENPSLLNDTFEAIIGAYFLDAGIEAVKTYITPSFTQLAQNLVSFESQAHTNNLIDPKNRFQQWALAHRGTNPEYVIIEERGPDHAKEFTAEVRINGIFYGLGKGKRKQQAQKDAATAALQRLGVI